MTDSWGFVDVASRVSARLTRALGCGAPRWQGAEVDENPWKDRLEEVCMIRSVARHVRVVLALAATAVVTLSITLSVSAPARAAADTSIMNYATSRCLDGSTSQGVRLNTCNGGEYQNWTLRATGANGNWELYHAATQKCLDGSISNGVRLNSCNGSEYQEWELRNGSYADAFLNIATRKCLDGSISEGVRLKTCNNTEYQRWY